jgi:divalent metal cation (Fe/Co/Zn/Cd) transporter
MKTLIGGAIAVAIGIIGVLVWWKSFFAILAGFIPVMLLLGGGLAIYLGFDELMIKKMTINIKARTKAQLKHQ